MKKKGERSIPDFSRKKPGAGRTDAAPTDDAGKAKRGGTPKQPVKPQAMPPKSGGGRRGA